MPSNPTNSLRLEKQGQGEHLNTWGTGNGLGLNNVLDMVDAAVAGVMSIPVAGNVVLTSSNYTADQARNAALILTGAPTAPFTVTTPGASKLYLVRNTTGQPATFTTGAGTTATIPAGQRWLIACDGTNWDGAVIPLTLDQNGKPVAPVDFNGQNVTGIAALTVGGQISGVVDPLSPQQAATKNYVDATAWGLNQGILPGQTGNAGKSLLTNGGNAYWGYAPLSASQQTANYTLQASDHQSVVRCSGTITLGLPTSPATGFWCYVANTGSGQITWNGTTDGVANWVMYPGEVRLLQYDGASFKTLLVRGGAAVFPSSGTWIKPPGINFVAVWGVGAAGGGQGGGTAYGGGAGGGAGRGFGIWAASEITGNQTVTIPAGGTAGTGSTTSTGNPGGTGGNAAFGNFLTAYGGAGGGAGANGSSGGGGGERGAGSGTLGGTIGGGNGSASGSPNSPSTANGGSGGGSCGATSYPGAASLFGGAGGGGGGNPGGAGSVGGASAYGVGGTAGAIGGGAGGPGGNSTATGYGGGGGGGGGSISSTTTPGGAGGIGGFPGGGGGGGGAATGGATGGAGGVGGAGQMIVLAW